MCLHKFILLQIFFYDVFYLLLKYILFKTFFWSTLSDISSTLWNYIYAGFLIEQGLCTNDEAILCIAFYNWMVVYYQILIYDEFLKLRHLQFIVLLILQCRNIRFQLWLCISDYISFKRAQTSCLHYHFIGTFSLLSDFWTFQLLLHLVCKLFETDFLISFFAVICCNTTWFWIENVMLETWLSFST